MRAHHLPILTILAVALVPTAAAAEPECIQVYPWSELCQGDVVGFLEAYVGGLPTIECASGTRVCELVSALTAACRDGDCISTGEILPPPACPGGPPCPPEPTGSVRARTPPL